MENRFIRADDVARELDVSKHYAYKLIRKLNEELKAKGFVTIRDYDHAYRLIFEYLEAFYNTKRIHSHCDYMSPNDYEELYRRLQQGELQMAG